MEAKPSAIGRVILELLKILFVFAIPIFLSGCANVGYIFENSVGQWKLFNKERPIEEVLSNPRTSQEVRNSLNLVTKAKKFAVEQIGLKATSNYRNYVDVNSSCVTYVVSAADPLKLEELTWNFPLVGEVPYLGYFNKDSARQKAKELGVKSDSWIRCVPTFSSLGWFSDPIYSSMLQAGNRDLVDTVIHESLHATVWVKGSVDFNEKLANFVGLEGSLLFLKFEVDEGAVEAARKEVAGEKAFGDFMEEQKKLYLERVHTLEEKEKFYQEIGRRYQNFVDERKSSIIPLRPKFEGWNNAAFLAYANYYSDFSPLQTMLASCGGNLKRFVRWISWIVQNKTERLEGAPEEHLASLMKETGCSESDSKP